MWTIEEVYKSTMIILTKNIATDLALWLAMLNARLYSTNNTYLIKNFILFIKKPHLNPGSYLTGEIYCVIRSQ